MNKLDDFDCKVIDVNGIYEMHSSFRELYDKLETYDRELLVKSVDNIVNDVISAFIDITSVICEIEKIDLKEKMKKKGIKE